MLLLIDNYDSFTYNLFHYLGELGAEVDVHRNDALSADEALALAPQGIVISPRPVRSGSRRHLPGAHRKGGRPGATARGLPWAPSDRPGVRRQGGRAPRAKHGKVSTITHDGSGILASIPSPFQATRYHSLMVNRDGWPLPARHGRKRGRRRAGPATPRAADLRRAVPPGEHRHPARPCAAPQLPPDDHPLNESFVSDQQSRRESASPKLAGAAG